MVQIKAVPEPQAAATKERRISETTAPYFNLTQSIEVARVIHQHGGTLAREQLAAALGYSGPKNGTFLTRVSAAKIFGVVDQPPQSDAVRVTPRGIAIVAPVSDADANKAKLDAFMAVELFKKVFDEYRGRELPADIGLTNLFENTYKIIPTRTGQAVKVMLDSAETAGLFMMTGAASRKMIVPASLGSSAPIIEPPKPPKPSHDERRENGGGGGGNGGGHDGSKIHPAIYGLIADLPTPGNLSKTKRDALVEAFTATVKFIYPDAE